MKPGAGKRKGGAYERSVGRRLSLWLTEGKDSTQLIRSVGSGGWPPSASGDEPWRQIGDLAPNGPEGERFRRRFAVECKHHAVVDLWQLLGSGTPFLLRWWNKLNNEILQAVGISDMEPMLVVRANHKPEIVVLRRQFGTGRPQAVVWNYLVVLPLAVLLAEAPGIWLQSGD